VETVEDFRWAASRVRDLLRAWRFYSEGTPPHAWECPVWAYDHVEALAIWGGEIEHYGLNALAAPPATPQEAAIFVTRYLSDGLVRFHPRLDRLGNDRLPYREWFPTYPICCLDCSTTSSSKPRTRLAPTSLAAAPFFFAKLAAPSTANTAPVE
jgi:hypothetical protein